MHNKLPLGLLTFGLLLLVLGVFIILSLVAPLLLEAQISKDAELRNGSDTWERWTEPDSSSFINFYIFNITNPQAVESGDKPELTKLGPYVYKEKRRRNVVQIEVDGETLSYMETTDYFFVPEKSSGSEQDLVSIVNIPLVTVVKKAEEIPYLPQFMTNLYILRFKPRLVVRKTVGDVLFQGYYEPMLSESKDLTGEEGLKDNKFGFAYPRNGSESDLYEIDTGISDISKLGRLLSWNKSEELGELCGFTNDSSSGSIFPPFMGKENTLQILDPDLCRSVNFSYQHEIHDMGVMGYRYTASQSEPGTHGEGSRRLCECLTESSNYSDCVTDGKLQLLSCRQSFIDIEPITGNVLRNHKRFQMNVELKRMRGIDAFRNVPDAIFPIYSYVEINELNYEDIQTLKSRLLTPQQILEACKWILVVLSLASIMAGVVVLILRLRKKKYPVM